jgi:hypothetical protein
MLARRGGVALSRAHSTSRRALQGALQSFFLGGPLQRQALFLATHPLGGVGSILELAACKTLGISSLGDCRLTACIIA